MRAVGDRMSADSLEERTVEVLALLGGEVDEELLLLYFENSRRSGGGPIVSVQKSSGRALLEFEEAEAAARVLSKGHHVVHNVELLVRRPAAKDPRRLLLRGVNPGTSSEMVELYVENMMGLNTQDYTLLPTPGRDLVLIRLSQPFTQDFQKVSANISRRPLDKANISLERVEQTDSVLVENLPPGATADLLLLYFESSRGGGRDVKAVIMLSESSAKVSFVNYESVEAVLERPHKLDDSELLVKPYFDFLQPSEPPHDGGGQDSSGNEVEMQTDSAADVQPEEQEAMQEENEAPEVVADCVSIAEPLKRVLLRDSAFQVNLQKENPDVVFQMRDDGVHIAGNDALQVQQLRANILDFLNCMTEERVSVQPAVARLLAREDVRQRLADAMSQKGLSVLYSVSDSDVLLASLCSDEAERARGFLTSQARHFSLTLSSEHQAMLACREWAAFLEGLSLCSVEASAGGGSLDGWTLDGLEGEKRAAVQEFLGMPVERETVIPMEPGALRYLQIHCHQLLADMNQVSILPLETDDVCGLKLQGPAVACQMAEEVLQGVISSICTKTITFIAPGLTRFLQQQECLSILHEMEAKFQVLIIPQLVPWDHLRYEDFSMGAWKMLPNRFPRVSSDDSPKDLKSDSAQSQASGSSDQALLDNAKKVVCTVQEQQQDASSNLDDLDNLDLYTAGELGEKQDNDLEEEAQLSLAIQYSMESAGRSAEEEEQQQLQRALELSMRGEDSSFQVQKDTKLNRLHKDINSMSLADAIHSSNTVDLVAFAGYSSDLSRVNIAFNKKVNQRQVEERLEDRGVRKMSEYHWNCLQVIKRKHAVDIQVQGTVITVSGFKDFVFFAVKDVKKMLEELSRFVPDREVLKTVQWVWHDPASTNTTPYSPEATLYIENAWRRKMSDVAVFLDGQHHVVDFEKMKEFNNDAKTFVKISRKLLDAPDLDEELPEEEYSLLSDLPGASQVDVNSDEFQAVVRDFYKTIHEYHSKIRIIQVEKIVNRLLFNQYKLKKASVSQRASYPEVERTLYHGTSESSVKEICIHGFNRSFCGKNATVYGQGVYFAVNSSLSVQDRYSPPNADGHKYIFVCKVLTGDFTKGCHSMKTAPLKESSDVPLRYDSVTDDISKPSMFIIFNDTQAFPEYVITCQNIFR